MEGFGKPKTFVFQVLSIISTTGFATTDYNIWPTLSQSILVILMFTGVVLVPLAGIKTL